MEVTGWTYWHAPEELSNYGFEDSTLNSRNWWQKASQIVVEEVRKHNYHLQDQCIKIWNVASRLLTVSICFKYPSALGDN